MFTDVISSEELVSVIKPDVIWTKTEKTLIVVTGDCEIRGPCPVDYSNNTFEVIRFSPVPFVTEMVQR